MILLVVIARSASDEAIQSFRAALDCFASLAMTKMGRWRKLPPFLLARSLQPSRVCGKTLLPVVFGKAGNELRPGLCRRRARRLAAPPHQLTCAKCIGTNFPWGTFIINITGSTVMGLIAGYLAFKGEASQPWRLFIMTGILGGYTTFSAFSLDAATAL